MVKRFIALNKSEILEPIKVPVRVVGDWQLNKNEMPAKKKGNANFLTSLSFNTVPSLSLLCVMLCSSAVSTDPATQCPLYYRSAKDWCIFPMTKPSAPLTEVEVLGGGKDGLKMVERAFLYAPSTKLISVLFTLSCWIGS